LVQAQLDRDTQIVEPADRSSLALLFLGAGEDSPLERGIFQAGNVGLLCVAPTAHHLGKARFRLSLSRL